MLSLTLVFTSLLAGFVAAQNSTTFDPTAVDLTTKNQWCNGETTNCPLLCGGQSATQANTCFGQTLKYTCTCANGSQPASIDQYQGTLPNFICEATFKQCRMQNPGSNSCLTCGTLLATNVPTASSSAMSSGAAATSMGGGSAATSAGGSTASKGAAANVNVKVEGVAAVGGVLAALLL